MPYRVPYREEYVFVEKRTLWAIAPAGSGSDRRKKTKNLKIRDL
jgi:hypothetical protein